MNAMYLIYIHNTSDQYIGVKTKTKDEAINVCKYLNNLDNNGDHPKFTYFYKKRE